MRPPFLTQNMEVPLKKGAWTDEEDLKLVSYIKRYGIWNWAHMPKAAGLARTGKSCRLRWMNYLKPNIKRGNITKDEEETILKLQKTMGNKWSVIATKLPGRTDNEIKNYYNTHLRKRLRKINTNNNNVKTQQPTASKNEINNNNLPAKEIPLIVVDQTPSIHSQASTITVSPDFSSSNNFSWNSTTTSSFTEQIEQIKSMDQDIRINSGSSSGFIGVDHQLESFWDLSVLMNMEEDSTKAAKQPDPRWSDQEFTNTDYNTLTSIVFDQGDDHIKIQNSQVNSSSSSSSSTPTTTTSAASEIENDGQSKMFGDFENLWDLPDQILSNIGGGVDMIGDNYEAMMSMDMHNCPDYNQTQSSNFHYTNGDVGGDYWVDLFGQTNYMDIRQQ